MVHPATAARPMLVSTPRTAATGLPDTTVAQGCAMRLEKRDGSL